MLASEDAVWLLKWWHNKLKKLSHTQSPHPMECICQCTAAYTWWDPYSAQLGNAATTTTTQHTAPVWRINAWTIEEHKNKPQLLKRTHLILTFLMRKKKKPFQNVSCLRSKTGLRLNAPGRKDQAKGIKSRALFHGTQLFYTKFLHWVPLLTIIWVWLFSATEH